MRRDALSGLLVLLAAVLGGLAASPTPALADEVHEVMLGAGGFSPAELRIAAGDEVRWVNRTGRTQTLLGEGGSWDSGPLRPGEAFALAPRPGSFRYATADGGAEGLLVVERGVQDLQPAQDPPPPPEAAPPGTLPDTGAPPLVLLGLGGGLLGGGLLLLRKAERLARRGD